MQRANVGTCNVGTCNVRTWERGNVGTWERGTWERGNVRTQAQVREEGDTGAGARPHSFIRSLFVDNRDGTGMRECANVQMCKRANSSSRHLNVQTGKQANLKRVNIKRANKRNYTTTS